MKRAGVLVVILSVLFVCDSAWAGNNLSADLRKAQKALAAEDYEKAFAEYIKVAEDKNNPLAQFSVGMFYENGWGRPADPNQAYGWFEKAALGGIPAAQHRMGDYLAEGLCCKADPAQAALWYKKAAAGGHTISLCSLAELYMTGEGVEKDPNQAIALCGEVAQKGSVPAQVRLGRFFLEGDESIRDYAKAHHWFETAAQCESAEAKYYLGVMYRDFADTGGAQEIARYWFESAASQQYGPAYLPTAELYLGAPVDPNSGVLAGGDLAKAYLWLSAAGRGAEDLKDKARANELLAEVNDVMPASWKPKLDAKVEAHFSKKK